MPLAWRMFIITTARVNKLGSGEGIMFGHGSGLVSLVEEPNLVYLPLWHETLAGVEYLKLKASPVYYGYGIPLGDDSPVIPVPGFLGFDTVMIEMRFWLRRIGYQPFCSQIGLNAECPDILAQRLLATVLDVHAATGRKIHLIGHSLGGMLSRSVANQAPDKIASVITLASPITALRVNPFVNQAMAFVRDYVSIRNNRPQVDCFSQSCSCGFPDTIRGGVSPRIPRTAIYTKQDGVVDWQTCRDVDGGVNIEVGGTHVGMIWNPRVYRIIAEHLWKARRRKSKKSKPRASSQP